jgi:hypothetical protein
VTSRCNFSPFVYIQSAFNSVYETKAKTPGQFCSPSVTERYSALGFILIWTDCNQKKSSIEYSWADYKNKNWKDYTVTYYAIKVEQFNSTWHRNWTAVTRNIRILQQEMLKLYNHSSAQKMPKPGIHVWTHTNLAYPLPISAIPQHRQLQSTTAGFSIANQSTQILKFRNESLKLVSVQLVIL